MQCSRESEVSPRSVKCVGSVSDVSATVLSKTLTGWYEVRHRYKLKTDTVAVYIIAMRNHEQAQDTRSLTIEYSYT